MLEKIGNVNIDLRYYKGEDSYTDGSIEDEILEIVKSFDDYKDVIAKDNRWPILYHLSKDRENIIESFDFTKKEEILEIGAGCGAITGCLADKGSHVDCIELSKKRSYINAYRNKRKNNINIIVGNFEDIVIEKKYDVITAIGVFEYSRSFINSDSPYDEFLKRVYNSLKEDGIFYIAIENKFGLKYFAGCNEDHTGKLFNSIEGYNKYDGVKTFSYFEIKHLLENNGFINNTFYFPFPDYKLPIQIFSESYLPKTGQIRNIIEVYDRDREVFFNEEKAFDNIIESNCFNVFSNSFLIECKKR